MGAQQPEVAIDRLEQTREVVQRLRARYGTCERRRRGDVLDSLIGTVLSQHTSDVNSGRAFGCLKTRYPSWDQVLDASPEDLADAIRSGGLATLKAARIQDILRTVRESRGDLDLDFLVQEPLETGRAYLEALPGVGPKTAACVLLFACELPALPVDTHVHRVSLRLGLIPPGTSADAAHRLLEALVPAGDVYDFHVDVIALGREICVARLPRCPVCPLRDICDLGRATAPAGSEWTGPEVYKSSRTENSGS